MNTKHKFWKLLAALLLYSLITHWKDAKNGAIDAWNEPRSPSNQSQPK